MPEGDASVAKLVDALDLGSSAFGRGGSSPSTRTIQDCQGGKFMPPEGATRSAARQLSQALGHHDGSFKDLT